MPMRGPSDRSVHNAMAVTLVVAMMAAARATAIHWRSCVHQLLDRIIPHTMFVVFGALLIMLLRQPRRVIAIGRSALLVSGVALVAPTWLYVDRLCLLRADN